MKPIFGGVRQSTVKDGSNIELGAEYGSGDGMGMGITTTTNNVITGTTATHKTIDLGTTVHKTIDLGVVKKEAIGTGGVIVNQNLGSNEIQLVSNEENQMANSGLALSTRQIDNTNRNQKMEVMDLGNEENIDINRQVQFGGIGTNSVKKFVTTGPTTITTTTKNVKYTTNSGQPIIGESNILSPIVKTTVKQPIITAPLLNWFQNLL